MRLKRLLPFYGDAQDLWSIFSYLFPSAAASLMTAWSAIEGDQPWYVIIFATSGVFCFLSVAILAAMIWKRENDITGKLRIDTFKVLFGNDASSGKKIASCSVELQNKSAFDIFYKLEEAAVSLGRKSCASFTVDDATMIVQANSSNNISFASIIDIEPAAMTGELKLKIIYGKRKSTLNHKFDVSAEPQLATIQNQEGKLIGLHSGMQFKRINYD